MPVSVSVEADRPASATRDPGAARVGHTRLMLGSLFVLGSAVAVIIMLAFSARHGGSAALLHVGEDSDLRSAIESELGEVPLWDGQGHDGKYSYAVARDPLSASDSEVDHPAYRYRRYLYSLLGGGLGTLSPHGTLYGLMAVTALSFGLSVAATASVARELGVGTWSPVVGFLNVGVLGGVLHLTSDVMAFGLAMLGLALWLRDHRAWAVIAFVLAVWSKEVYALVPIALFIFEWWEERRFHARLLLPLAFAGIWAILLIITFPHTSVTNNAFALPFQGVATAWTLSSDGASLASQIVTWITVPCAALVAWRKRHRLLMAMIGVWASLAVISNEQILYEDSIRAFAPLFTFAILTVLVPWRDTTLTAAPQTMPYRAIRITRSASRHVGPA